MGVTGEEAKQALLAGSPVVFDHPALGPIVYAEIHAIRYMKGNVGVSVSLELYDRNKNSITVAPIKEVELYQK